MNQINQKRINDPVTIVIFGASGDLTHRKLIPALYSAYMQDLLPEDFIIIGFSRRNYDNDYFRNLINESLKEFSSLSIENNKVEKFLFHIYYHKGDISDFTYFTSLKNLIFENNFPKNHLYYLSIMPSLFESTVKSLSKAGLISEPNLNTWTRVVVEKPFGSDLESALSLNKNLLNFLDESQIFRIDHFLGKETVQNILSFRFANTIFETVFNRTFIDHIQITAAEEIGVEKGRGGYYDDYGALRDMLTNHLLQLMCLVTMEAPADLSANAIRNEKVKILRSAKIDQLENINEAVFRGQYKEKVESDGTIIKGYLDEDKINSNSDTETFIALRLMIDNWRWAGVPILLRTGKRMKKKTTEIAIQFKVPPLELFQQIECENDICDLTDLKPNMLIFQIQPNEGIFLKMGIKKPGMRFLVENAKMDFSYSGTWSKKLPEAYERLLLDILSGDSTLFTRSDEVEAEWRLVQPVIDKFHDLKPYKYLPGEWGVKEADALFNGTNGSWRNS